MAELCRVNDAPHFVMRHLRKSEIAITQIKSNVFSSEKTDSAPAEDAFIASVSLREGFDRDLWLDHRPVAKQPPQPAGVVTLLDLRRSVNIRFKSEFDIVQFYFSRKALTAVLDEENGKPVDELTAALSTAIPDDTFHRLALSLAPALDAPNEASRLFVDHVTMAAAAHFVRQYGKVTLTGRIARGGLAPWQLSRAKDLLEAHLDGAVALNEVAAECRLSMRHFARAFAQSTGLPPHRWLLQRRVEKAKGLLRDSELSLADIAKQSGFADQSHLTRVFAHAVGESPGAWRRLHHR